ncbi:MAG: spondin domain-containing protein [Actinomycetes bacterium]
MRGTTRVAALTAALIAVGGLLVAPAHADDDEPRLYEVTIKVRLAGQPLTPPLVATHRRSVEVFEVGEPASLGVQEIAENGNLAPLHTSLLNTGGVADVVAAAAPLVGRGVPGAAQFDQSVTFTIEASEGARYLSWVSMLICTNDGFTGVDGLRLPGDVGDRVRVGTAGYDAGTEVNTEDFGDIVPPCQGLVGIRSPTGETGTGTTNPALAEGGVITHHPGIAGGVDLIPAFHGWDVDRAVAKIKVTRVA